MSRDKKTDYEVLHDFVSGKITEEEMTEHQLKKLERVRSCYAMLIKFWSAPKVVKRLRKLYGLSQSQAFRDIDLTERLYGAIRNANKEFHRLIAIEMALETYRMAKKDRKGNVMAMANRNYIEATGTSINDPDLPFEKMEASVNIIVIPEHLQNQLVKNLNKGPVKWQPPSKEDKEEITEYEILNNGAATDQGGDSESS